MKTEFENILKEVILLKKSRNARIVRKAEKIESYLNDLDKGDITESELKKLLGNQVIIDKMNEFADEMELAKKVNDLASAISKILK